jgi:dihydroorotase
MSAISTLSWLGGEAVTLVLSRATVMDPRAGIDAPHDVVIRDGTIAELAPPGTHVAGESGLDSGEIVDAQGLHALPAFFDPHVHLRIPGREDEEDLETGSRAAAVGGFCGIVAMANTEPVVDSAPDLRALIRRAEREASIPIGLVATVTRGMAGEGLTEMAELREAGALGFSDDGLPVHSSRVLRRALQYQKLCGGTLLLHAEDPDLSGDGVMHEGAASAALGLTGIPSISESTMIARDATLALYEQGRVHVMHLSAHESVEEVARAKAAGARLSAEVTPHHLTLTDEEVRSLDARYKMNPPLRSAEHRRALIEGLRSGTIDCVATDHAPHSLDEKEVPFEQAAMGVTGLETAFAVLHTDLVEPGLLELGTLAERMSAGARVFDLDPPSLAPGSEASIALVDTRAGWEAGAEGWASRSANSCFTGRTLHGRVVLTLAGGRLAFRREQITAGAAG